MKHILKRLKAKHDKQDEREFKRRGFYLVHSSGRHFISDVVCSHSLEQVCNKFLTATDYNYWIDYSFGLDVMGYIHWSNIDQTDRF